MATCGLEEALAESKAAKEATAPPAAAAPPTPAAGPVCPECQQGKHQNCEGQAWDVEADEPTACACPDGSHAS